MNNGKVFFFGAHGTLLGNEEPRTFAYKFLVTRRRRRGRRRRKRRRSRRGKWKKRSKGCR